MLSGRTGPRSEVVCPWKERRCDVMHLQGVTWYYTEKRTWRWKPKEVYNLDCSYAIYETRRKANKHGKLAKQVYMPQAAGQSPARVLRALSPKPTTSSSTVYNTQHFIELVDLLY